MGRIIRFNPDPHQAAQKLLPWYLTDQLDDEERARFEAHLHGCAECQAELRVERRLAEAVAGLPFDVDEGWTTLLRQIEAQAAPRGPGAVVRKIMAGAGGGGWALAAQFVLAVVIAGLALPLTHPPRYHALGATRPAAVGDVIVIFRPEAQAQDLTQALKSSGARLVDGPTAADAYVLDVPLPARNAALSKLRAYQAVAMAEPIDPAPRP
jgi:anti-sigma factor RsiW